MYKIREAKIDDYASFLLLYQTGRTKEDGNYPADLEQGTFEEIVKHPFYEFYVVENNGELQAFTIFYRKKHGYLLQPKEKDFLFVEELFVKSSEEKKGLKLYLYEKIERYAKRNGIERIETLLPAGEKELIAHYEERFKLMAEDIVLRR